MAEVNVAPIIVKTGPGAGYMQKVKPMAFGQADLDLVALKLGVPSTECSAITLDDVIEDSSGARHPARRLVVTHNGASVPIPEGANASSETGDLVLAKDPPAAKPPKARAPRKTAKPKGPVLKKVKPAPADANG